MEFHEQLRTARKAKGLTQVELAERVGISVNSVRLYEAGKITPNLETLKKIALALDVDAIGTNGKEFIFRSGTFEPVQSVQFIPQPQYSDWKAGAKETHTPSWEKARRAFYELPNNWQKDTAINWQIEILHKKMGKNYNNAVFEALLRLYQSDDSFSQELAERLESLLYGQPTDPDKK